MLSMKLAILQIPTTGLTQRLALVLHPPEMNQAFLHQVLPQREISG
jgi:hypothetical protein